MKTKQHAFTLIELLVVIAIIGILVALLLPAVQAARESARRMQCTNNLKQISLAVHNYADSHNAFPVGCYSCCWGTWLVGILPYVEQKQLFDNYVYFGAVPDPVTPNVAQSNLNSRYAGVPNRANVTTKQLMAYTCPSDSIGARPTIFNGITFHNYVGNHGNTALLRDSPLGVTSTGAPNEYGGAPFIQVASTVSSPQVVRLSEVVDGLSNTLLFSETVQGQDGDLRGFAWWNGGAHFETLIPPNSSLPDRVEQNCIPTNIRNPPCTIVGAVNPRSIAARSRHPGGVGASFCDGSVRFVSNTINLDTWRSISTNRGGETVGEF
jgi:prepilin-type N-terminal cleavage/methylation domain-containing protein/prepilin-type processing-associated H-X9-DG protein